jgi:ribosomal protein S18 acetylase RimI-like enzyme
VTHLSNAATGGVVHETTLQDESSRRVGSFLVRSYGGFEELPEGCGGLFDKAGQESVFLTLPWFRHFAQTALDKRDRLRIYAICGADPASGSLGLFVARSSRKNAHILSLTKLSALTNYYSPFFSPHISFPGISSQETVNALALAISKERPRWDTVEIKPLDVDSAVFSQLVAAFKASRFVVQTFFCAGNWYEPINGRSFEEYFGDLRSSVRNIAKSKNKKIERSGRVRCEIIQQMDGLDVAIAAYNRIYAASWKVKEPYPDFVPGLIKTCAVQGSLRLGIAYVDGEPAAAQVWIVHAGVASIYKIAYDQKFRDLSVGTYLTTHLMKYVIDVDRVAEVDYLTGDDRYKSDWMSKRRERWGILALNPRTPLGALAIVRHVGGRAAKRTAMAVVTRFRSRNERSKSSDAATRHQPSGKSDS